MSGKAARRSRREKWLGRREAQVKREQAVREVVRQTIRIALDHMRKARRMRSEAA